MLLFLHFKKLTDFKLLSSSVLSVAVMLVVCESPYGTTKVFQSVSKSSLKPALESFWLLANSPPMNRQQWLNCMVVCVHKCLAFPVPGGGRALCLSDFEGSAALTYRAAGADHAGHGCHRGPVGRSCARAHAPGASMLLPTRASCT